MKTTVSMNAQGRLTIPAAAREALKLHGPAELELQVTSDEIVLRPAIIVPREDAWAYTAEHLRRIEEALGDQRSGRTQILSEEQLQQLSDRPQ